MVRASWDRGLAIGARSAGFMAENQPPLEEMAKVASRMGLDIESHRSRTLDEHVLAEADLILTMTGAQVLDIVGMAGDTQARTLTLLELVAAAKESPVPWSDSAALRRWIGHVTNRPLTNLMSGDHDIEDPVGRPMRIFRRVASQIEEAVEAVLPDPTTELSVVG